MPLTDTACKNAKPQAKPYKKADGGGMYLEVMPNGSRYWRLKYRYLGKEKRLALGVYPDVSLIEARKKREAARQQLADGIDPSLAKQERKRQLVESAANSFEAVALEWHKHSEDGWSDRHAENVLARMNKDLLPELGPLPIASINSQRVLQAIRKIEARGAHEIARRTLQVCSQVFTYAIGTGRASHNPAAGLNPLLKPYKKGHFPALEAKELPAFLLALEQNEARLHIQTRIATKLLLLTLVRTSELIKATWDEFDLKGKEWIIPGSRMKMGRPHIVPLSSQVIELLKRLKELAGNSHWILPNQVRPQKHMSEGTILGAIKRLGYKGKMTGRGFRSLGASAIAEKLGYRREIVDRQLAHAPESKIEAAYHRADFLTDRCKMMQQWADWVEKQEA